MVESGGLILTQSEAERIRYKDVKGIPITIVPDKPTLKEVVGAVTSKPYRFSGGAVSQPAPAPLTQDPSTILTEQARQAELARQEQARQAEAQRQAELARQEQARQAEAQRQEATRQAGISAQQATQRVAVLSEGGVRIGKTTYIGSVSTPSGLTANEYARKVRQEAVTSGLVKPEDVSRTTITFKTGTETLPSGEKIIYDEFGNPIGVESDIEGGIKSYPLEKYMEIIENIQENFPQERFLNPVTGETFTERQPIDLGKSSSLVSFTTTPVKIYTTPKGEPIFDIQEYLKEKNIPSLSEQNKIVNTTTNFNLLTYTPTFDVKNLLGQRKPFTISGQYYPVLESGKVYILEPTETALDVALLTTGIFKGGFLAKEFIKGGLSRTIAGVDIIGELTGVNKLVSASLQSSSSYLYRLSETTKIGKYPSLLGGAILETASYLPAQSKTEVALDLALGGAFISKYKILSVPTKVGVLGYSGYKIITGETLGEKGLGVLGVLAISPDILKITKKGYYRLSPDYVPTKTDITGIKYADIDLGKTDFDINTGILTKEISPLRVEFVPSRKSEFSGEIIPLETFAMELSLRENPISPKITSEQAKILQLVKDEGAIVSGSFAQQTLIKESRPFKDLDILVPEPKLFAEKLASRYGDVFKVEQKAITDSPLGKFDIYKVYKKRTGKQIADIDPLAFSEEGYAKIYSGEEITFNGLKLLPPEVRLTSKIIQQTRPLPTGKRLKVALDIAQLTGQKELATSPSLLRGYGFLKAEQKLIYLQGEFYATHGGTDIIPRFGEKILIGGEKVGSPKLFYETPSIKELGIAYARTSRMGLGVLPEEASLKDILSSERLTFFGKRKQVIIEVGKLGDKFIQPNLGTSEIEVARVLPKKGKELKILKRFRTIAYDEPIQIAILGEKELGSNINKLSTEEMNKIISKQINDISIRRTLPKKVSVITPFRFEEERITESDITRRQPFLKRTIVPRVTIREREIIRTGRFPERRTTPRIIRQETPERILRTDITERDIRTTREIRRPETIIRTPPSIIRIPIRIINPPIKQLIKVELSKKLEKIKTIPTFTVFVKRKGEFKPLQTDITYGRALKLGEEETSLTLGRTFKIRKTGKKEIFAIDELTEPDLRRFRPYKIRRGKTITTPDEFIQRQTFALSSRQEKEEIRKAKQLNKLINL